MSSKGSSGPTAEGSVCAYAGVALPDPNSRDVVDHILRDHVRMHLLFQGLRNRQSDRVRLLHEFANLLVAHSETEERVFYPVVQELSTRTINGKKEVAHEVGEHVEGLIALLDLMDITDTTSQTWEEKLSILVERISHHLNEEELTVHNLARVRLSEEKRAAMGDAFAAARNEGMKRNVGDVENVRKLVKERASIAQKLKVRLAS